MAWQIRPRYHPWTILRSYLLTPSFLARATLGCDCKKQALGTWSLGGAAPGILPKKEREGASGFSWGALHSFGRPGLTGAQLIPERSVWERRQTESRKQRAAPCLSVQPWLGKLVQTSGGGGREARGPQGLQVPQQPRNRRAVGL